MLRLLRPLERPARFTFAVVNFPLERRLTLDGFTLAAGTSFREDSLALRQAQSEHRYTGDGWYDVSFGFPNAPEPWDHIRRADEEFDTLAGILCDLLSFACRRSVQIVDATLHVREGRQGWQYLGGNVTRTVQPGRAHGIPWIRTQDQLEQFLARSYPLLKPDAVPPVHESTARGVALRAAMRHLSASRVDDWTEWQFMKAWTALETLLGELGDTTEEAGTRTGSEEEASTSSTLQRETRRGTARLEREQLPESAPALLRSVFRDYPRQRVAGEDLARWVEIRNSIARTGYMQPRPLGREESADAYSVALENELQRLRSLVERVILGLLGERSSVMDVPWQNWRDLL